MKLNCESCQEPISADDIDLSTALAKCRECNSVFSFQDKLTEQRIALDDQKRLTPLVQPKNVTLTKTPTGKIITWKWRSVMAVFMVPFTLFWNTFIVVWMSIAISQGAWSFVAFGSLHASVGIFLIYTTICQLLNTTTITITNDVIEIKTGPIPTKNGNITLQRTMLKRIYLTEIPSTKSKTPTYNLVYVDLSNTEKPIFKDIDDLPRARFLEQELLEAAHLKSTNRYTFET